MRHVFLLMLTLGSSSAAKFHECPKGEAGLRSCHEAPVCCKSGFAVCNPKSGCGEKCSEKCDKDHDICLEKDSNNVMNVKKCSDDIHCECESQCGNGSGSDFCYLKGISDPIEPKTKCFSDVKFSKAVGKFFSFEACKEIQKSTTTSTASTSEVVSIAEDESTLVNNTTERVFHWKRFYDLLGQMAVK